MKGLNEKFTDEEHQALLKVKGSTSWHDFILKLIKFDEAAILTANAPELGPTDSSEDFATEYYRWLGELGALFDE